MTDTLLPVRSGEALPTEVTPERAAWAAAWCAAWAEMPPIHTDREVTVRKKDGGTFSYRYLDLGTLLGLVRPVLAKHGLAITQRVEGTERAVVVTTIIEHRDGWREEFGPTSVPASGDAQAWGAAITYARRYSLAAALGIATEDDTDAAPQREPTKRAPAKKKEEEPVKDWRAELVGLLATRVLGDQVGLAAEFVDAAIRDTGIEPVDRDTSNLIYAEAKKKAGAPL